MSAVLAGAHMPLVLLCTGVLLTAPQMRVPQVRKVATLHSTCKARQTARAQAPQCWTS